MSETLSLPQKPRNPEEKYQGYVVLEVAEEYTPRGSLPWARRLLRVGETVVNKNQLDDWRANDEGFRTRLKDGSIKIGRPSEPVAEAAPTSRETALEARIAQLEATLEAMAGNKKGGKP